MNGKIVSSILTVFLFVVGLLILSFPPVFASGALLVVMCALAAVALTAIWAK